MMLIQVATYMDVLPIMKGPESCAWYVALVRIRGVN